MSSIRSNFREFWLWFYPFAFIIFMMLVTSVVIVEFMGAKSVTTKTSVRTVTGQVMTTEQAKQFNFPAAITGFAVGKIAFSSPKRSGMLPGVGLGLLAGNAASDRYCMIPTIIEGETVVFKQPESVCETIKLGDTIEAIESCSVRQKSKTGRIIETFHVRYTWVGKK